MAVENKSSLMDLLWFDQQQHILHWIPHMNMYNMLYYTRIIRVYNIRSASASVQCLYIFFISWQLSQSDYLTPIKNASYTTDDFWLFFFVGRSASLCPDDSVRGKIKWRGSPEGDSVVPPAPEKHGLLKKRDRAAVLHNGSRDASTKTTVKKLVLVASCDERIRPRIMQLKKIRKGGGGF